MEEERIPRVWESESITGEVTGRYQTAAVLHGSLRASAPLTIVLTQYALESWSILASHKSAFRDAVLPEPKLVLQR